MDLMRNSSDYDSLRLQKMKMKERKVMKDEGQAGGGVQGGGASPTLSEKRWEPELE